jgi:hypothetical protein
MFICDGCGKAIGPSIIPFHVVKEWRQRTYPFRSQVMRPYNRQRRRDHSQWADDSGGKGWEIVREATVCAACLSK